MKFTLATVLSLFAVATAAPSTHSELIRREDPTEVQILNYALTLEHLESAFYKTYVAKYSQQDFINAGFPAFLRGRLSQIAEHEAQHVTFLKTALGDQATAACTYKFPVNSVTDFVAVAQVLEGVGVTAYLGAAHFLHTPAYLTAAGSILTTEARHNAWINSVGMKSFPWSGPEDTPQTLNQVFSLAAPFITSCPSSNPSLPVKAFPALAATLSSDMKTVSLQYSGAKSGQFLALLSGLNTKFVAINNGKATLPSGLQGTVYALVSSDGSTVSDDKTVAGMAILTFPFSSYASNPGM